MTECTTFSQTRIQLHLNTISKNANGAQVFTGNFLCGAERVKRFVKVHLHSIVRHLKKDKRNVDVAPTWKNFCGRPCHVHTTPMPCASEYLLQLF